MPTKTLLKKLTDLNRLIVAQNYKGYNAFLVKKLIRKLKVKESLEVLLAALKQI